MEDELLLEPTAFLQTSLTILVLAVEVEREVKEYYLISLNPDSFLLYTRFYPSEFEELYQGLEHYLIHQATHLAPICARRRLCIYLRYVAYGTSFRGMSAEFSCGATTTSAIVSEVAEAIIQAYFARTFPPPTRADFEGTARKTQIRYDYPRACGFLDGKHIAILKPPHAGSAYFDYKQFHSIVLLAICDCDYKIVAFDIGAPGRIGDAGILRRSTIKRYFSDNDDIFPPTRELAGVGAVQYHFLVDGGFGQDFRYIRPYRQHESYSESKARFNAKHSGARRLVESTFGKLCRRFAVLQKPIAMLPERASRLVISLLVIHNLLSRRQDAMEVLQRYPEYDGELLGLEWERDSSGTNADKEARNRITTHYDELYGIRRS